MKSTRVYDFNIPAGGSFGLMVSGSYFRIMTASAALEVQGDTFGNIYPVNTGQGLRGQDFKSLNLVNRSGATNRGTIIISDGSFVDDRITGDVSIIDGELSRSIGGSAFFAAGGTPAVAAQNAFIELWNPIGSGKRLIITDVLISSNTNSSISIRKEEAWMMAINTPVSKSTNVAAPISKYGMASSGYIAGIELEATFISASMSLSRYYKQPIVIEPGNGFLIMNSTTNALLYSTIQFIEQAL